MHPPHALQPCQLSPEILNAPLPFDLYNSKGLLLAKRGSTINGDNETLLAQPVYRLRSDTNDDEQLNLRRLEALFQRYEKLAGNWYCRSEDVHEIKRQVGDLVYLCGSSSELCLVGAAHLPGKKHATKHCFATAIVAILLGAALGWNLRRQHILARAALTMNLSQVALHEQCARRRGGINVREMEQIHQHPEAAAELLSQSPGVDLAWISAVDQHHENLDGSGYPLGLKGQHISTEARILRAADAWCALVMPRSGKPRKTPKDAIQELNRLVGSHFDPQIFLALKKLMGLYPPGTFVRLANRETAIIMSWDKQGSQPRYATSVLTAAGSMSREFKIRPLTRHGQEIRDYTYLDMAQLARFSVSRIWAAGVA
jgi:HD-GYP domain-containing protein (c-di-GMP phosphodiesterase class II)